MASHRGHPVSRGRCDGVIHLELWDAFGDDGRTLFDARADAAFAERLARVVGALIAGTLSTGAGFRFPDACRAIGEVWLAGGDPRVAACAAALSVPCWSSAHGAFAGVLGGRALLRKPFDAGAVVDLGQTSAKAWSPGRAPRRVEREGRTWAALVETALAGWAPERLVLGLPSELTARGAGPCSYYEGLTWDELARYVPCATVVVSDAELAGCAARAERAHRAGVAAGAAPPSGAAPLLALTLGHGVGAALVLP